MSRAISGELVVARVATVPTLESLLPRFFLARPTIRNEGTRTHYRRAVKLLGEMLERPATIDDLDDEIVGALLTYCVEIRRQSAATANGARKSLVCLWTWCRNRGMVQTGPTVPKLPIPKRIPRTFTGTEYEALVLAAADLPGTLSAMPKSVWWLTLLQLASNTGCRAGELLALRWEWIDWNKGWLVVPAEFRKGGVEDAAYALWKSTLEWLEPFKKTEGPIMPFNYNRSRFWQLWDELLKAAGLPTGRRYKTQALRRVFATQVDLHGGDASRALGHSSPQLARQNYIDATQRDATSEADRIPEKMRPLEIVKRGGKAQ